MDIENIKIIVATHKKYHMPKEDIYLPVQVGAIDKQSIGYQRDDDGENISAKNNSYCELTGLYWAWKNIDYEYLGLVHYRRYFKGSHKFVHRKKTKILSGQDLQKLLLKNDVLLPKSRNYFIETNESQYLHSHKPIGFTTTKEVIEQLFPEYMPSWNKIMKLTYGHRFNMFIMKKEICNAYCKWLFDVLFEVEKRLDITNWTPTEQRVFGYLSERLLDIWLDKNNIKYKEIPYAFLEKQNWLKKGFNFIKRKFS